MEQSESATGYAPDGGADGSASSSGRTRKAADAGPLDKLASFLEVQRKDMVPMFEMCLLMFLWGLANNLNDILIKQFKKAFELGNLQAVSASLGQALHRWPLTDHRPPVPWSAGPGPKRLLHRILCRSAVCIDGGKQVRLQA
jgi:hypothetical protein